MIRKIFLLAILVTVFALPAMAGHHDASYYKRTGTKPPMDVQGFIGPELPISEGNVGLGLQSHIIFKKMTMLSISADAIKLDGVTGSTIYTPPGSTSLMWPHPPPEPVTVPFESSHRTIGVVTIGVSFHIDKRK